MITVRDIGEFGLINRVAKLVPSSSLVMEGIGDDCAVLRMGDRIMLASTDLFVEDVHFRHAHARPEDIGWKAATAGISDIAAMGGIPLFGLVSLALPPDTAVNTVERLYDGLGEALAAHGAALVGGDTTRSADKMVIDIVVLGEALNGRYSTRRGARPGDVLAVTGNLGLAAAGFHALEHGNGAPALVHAHLRPVPRVREAQWLLSRGGLRAMIDVTDGLAQDAGHLAETGRLAVDLYTRRIPIAPPLEEYCRRHGVDPLDFVLRGGEDYELAMALDAVRAEKLVEAFQAEFDVPLTILGAFSEQRQGVYIDNRPANAAGFDHFRA